MPCVSSTIQVVLLTLSQEAEMGAGCGTPTHGPWAGLGTCELDWLVVGAGGRRRGASPGQGQGQGQGSKGGMFIYYSIFNRHDFRKR